MLGLFSEGDKYIRLPSFIKDEEGNETGRWVGEAEEEEVNPLEHPHTRVTGEMLVRRDVAHATATPLPGFFYAATVVFVFVAVHGLSENC